VSGVELVMVPTGRPPRPTAMRRRARAS